MFDDSGPLKGIISSSRLLMAQQFVEELDPLGNSGVLIKVDQEAVDKVGRGAKDILTVGIRNAEAGIGVVGIRGHLTVSVGAPLEM